MRVAKRMKRVSAILMAVIMIVTSLVAFPVKTKAATQYDLTQYMTSENLNGTVVIGSESSVAEINFVLPDSLNEKSEFVAEGINNMSVVLTVTEYMGSGNGTPGIQPYIESNVADTWYSGSVWENIVLNTQQTISFDLSSFDWNGGTSVNRLGIQFANLQSGSTLKYTISSITLSGTGNSSGTGSVPSGSQSSSNASTDTVQATITEVCSNSNWYEYKITVSNTSENSICGWAIKTYLPGVDVSGANTFDTCKLTYSDGYLYIEGQGDGSVVAGQSNNSAYNVKFGIGTSIGLDTSDIREITYEYGSEVNSGTNDLECNYTLTGAIKELSAGETPVGKHGKLHVDGIYLYDEYNEKIQLRGASLHGLQWDVGYNYINKGAFQSLRDEWGINAIRLPVYVTQSGYIEGAAGAMDTRIQNAVQYATELGMYVLIDWHVHSESGGTTNPNTWKDQANTFFTKYASMYKDYNNVLFEICNEPVNTVWYDGSGNDLYTYANSIIPTIRTYTDAVVIVGTNTWSQDVDDVAAHKLNTTNTMYTIHFYSATHMSSIRSKVQTALNSGVPVFCTEFGVCSADGNGSYNLDEADLWMDLFDNYSISYFCWQLSNKNEKSSYLTTSCTKTIGGWTNSDLSVTGIWLVNENRPKADAEAGGSGSQPTDPVAVTGVSLNKNTLTLDKGVEETLTATVSPSNATDKTVSWSTSDGNVATVDSSGKVTAAGAGQATITVKTTDGEKTASCTVSVYDVYAAPSAPTLASKTSTSVTLTAVAGCQYSKDGTTWQDSVTFSGLTPNTEYTFYARKKASGYYKESAASTGTKITTDKIVVTGVSLNKNTLTLDKGATETLIATVFPSNATDRTVSWSTNAASVATVSTTGKVTAEGAGEATITVKTTDGDKTASCTVSVYDVYAAPSAPTLASKTSTSVTLNVIDGCKYSMDGTTWQDSVTFSGLTPNTEYTFYARKEASGYYKTSAASAGTKITTDKIAVESVSLNKSTLTLDKDDTSTLTATISPSNATDKVVSWSTDDTTVATVDSSGKVTAVGAGQATITVTTVSGNKTAECVVTVWVTPEAPATTPSVEEPASDSITLEYMEGYEYRIYDAERQVWKDWQDSNIFSGLEPNTEYKFEIRKKADEENHQKAGVAVEVIASTLPQGATLVKVTGVELDKDAVTLNMESNKTATLSATVSPENATINTVSWSTSDENVVTVDETGKITAVGPGEAKITVKTDNLGMTDTCTVKVYQKYATPSAPTLVSVTTDTVTLQSVAGCEYSKDGVTWQASNVFTGLAEGTTYTFFVRKAKSGYYTTSDKSNGTNVTTKTTPTPDPTPEPDPTPTPAPVVNVTYRTHVQSYGWQTPVSNGIMSGTSGQAKRLEGIEISVNGNSSVGIQYTTHCQSYGWLPWSANGEMNGTEGEAKRLEAIKIQLTGSDADKYDVYYRVHAQSYGWLNWAKNGEPAGTAGYAKRLEGIQIVVVKKNESFNRNMQNISSVRNEAYIAKAGSSPVVGAPATDALKPVIPGVSTSNVAYKTHVQTYGWQGWKYNGSMSGTSGEAKRLEGINIKLTNKQYDGGINYTTHVQTYGWQGDVNNPNTWKKDGEMSGTSGEAKRLEAICITLTGEMAKHYDVYYRVHAQSFGWLDWAKNGEPAGTAGYAKRLEGIEIVLVEKGGKAPGSTARPYVEKFIKNN